MRRSREDRRLVAEILSYLLSSPRSQVRKYFTVIHQDTSADNIDSDPETQVSRPKPTHERTFSSMTATTMIDPMEDQICPRTHERTFSTETASTFVGVMEETAKRKGHVRNFSTDTMATIISTIEDRVLLEKGDRRFSRKSLTIEQSEKDLEAALDSSSLELPDKRYPRPIRALRYTLWNVYRRLFSIVFTANAIGLIVFFATAKNAVQVNIWNLATAASANIFVGTTIRQDYIQNILYGAAYLFPHAAPLRLRRIMTKVYENGGVHSGCGVAGTIWFIALTVVLSIQFADGLFTSKAVIGLTYTLLTMLLLIVILAYPALRFKSHNTFEMSHRFFGWAVILVFWIEVGLIAMETSYQEGSSAGKVMVKQPTFWFLVLITFHTILPWLRLRQWEFDAEDLSKHAVRLHFKKNVPAFTGIAISASPLFEWHPFATMPGLDGTKTGGSLIVSAAGDWTKDAVKNPRKHYWVKGVPKLGVLSLAPIFKRVVIVTTGSGIGPCLSIIASPLRKNQVHILWSCPSPLRIFGPEIVDCVRRADDDAIIIDSRASGRPDMVAITYRMYVEANAEAVFVISNPMLTRKIVYAMESRGVPAFGPVWDS